MNSRDTQECEVPWDSSVSDRTSIKIGVRRWLSAASLHHKVLWQGPAVLLRHSETSEDAFLAREKQPFSQAL